MSCLLRTAWICLTGMTAPLCAQEFHHIGTYRLVSQAKISRTTAVEIPVSPLHFMVHCDGVQVKLSISGQPETETTFQIYRSDGLVKQSPDGAAVEVVPGIQAICQAGGVLRHLRLCKQSLTLTTFPDAVDQSVVVHAESMPNSNSP